MGFGDVLGSFSGRFFPIFLVRPGSVFLAIFSDFGRRPKIDILPGRQTRNASLYSQLARFGAVVIEIPTILFKMDGVSSNHV